MCVIVSVVLKLERVARRVSGDRIREVAMQSMEEREKREVVPADVERK